MSNWLHRFLNPHCEHCREDKVCPSCETLKLQLEIANHEKKQLLERILEKPAPPEPVREAPSISIPRNIPWNVRRQMLEAEDREKARLMKEAPKPQSTEDLEKELEIVSAQREAGNGSIS